MLAVSQETFKKFLNRVVDDGIESVKTAYPDGSEKQEGSVDGFETCRHATPEILKKLLYDSYEKVNLLRAELDPNGYWYERYRSLQIEFVCNCIGPILKEPIIPLTSRGLLKYLEVVQSFIGEIENDLKGSIKEQ